MRYIALIWAGVFFCIGLQSPLSAQNMRWKKHVKVANGHLEKREYLSAADHFLAAWKKKPAQTELLHKAGLAFLSAKDYDRAVYAFEQTGSRFSDQPALLFAYAQALKQAGKYEAASRLFAAYYDLPSGDDKQESFRRKALQEIKGCELALQWSRQPPPPTVAVSHPQGGVNTSETEFAPIPINDNILYFSSTKSGRTYIYRAQKEGNLWQPAQLPANFPLIEKGHVCNGALSPDNERFYFTICEPNPVWGSHGTRCDLYLIRRRADSWTAPEILLDYINAPNTTTTHPSVVYNGDVEILYFASNRDGGFGGMDIWFTTRDINGGDLDFTFPINAGPVINTPDDEVTPHYSLEEGTLYFASNGHVGFGGFDIFQASGSRTNWSEITNLGMPINSSADDAYYIRAKFQPVGYFVSNRRFESVKTNTTQEDIFSFSRIEAPEIDLLADGRVYDQNGNPLGPATLSLFIISGEHERELQTIIRSEDGRYTFQLRAGKSYQVDIEVAHHTPASFELSTHQYLPGQNFGRPFFLERVSVRSEPKPIEPETPTPLPETLEPEDARIPEELDIPQTVDPNPTEAEPVLGTHYKVQLVALRSSDVDGVARFDAVRELGRLEAEPVPGKALFRILLGGYSSLQEARAARTACQANGFPDAYIVRYQGEERGNRVN
jgi:hypothetical protein